MNHTLMNNGATQPVSKVSISARLFPAFVYFVPAIGAALGAFLYINLMRALRYNENAGVVAILGGLAESTYPIIGSLYLQIICGIAVIAILVIRMMKQTKTASPSSWFFILSGILCLVPVVMVAEAQSLIIEVLIDPRNSPGVAAVVSTVSSLLILTIAAAPIIFVILMALSLIPFSTKKKPRWNPLIAAIFVQVLFIAAAIAFTLRFLWLNQA
jgi:hypothetical protein